MSSEQLPSLRVWIDFVCPFCFLAEEPIRDATAGLGVAIEWMPFELRPHPEPTLRPEGQYLQNTWRNAVYPTAEQMGVPIRLPDVSPQPYSRLAFEGLAFARANDKAQKYVDAILRAFFQQSLDIGRLGVLESVAKQIGLPGEAFRTSLQEGRHSEEHAAALDMARRFDIHAVPTILVGRRRIQGVPDAAQLRRAILQGFDAPQ